ncbi:hypothetical protein TCAL_10250 [Tigriopus californicus]|uniref:Uncharacterized protein n=1 Tax=Tigriopus californicus TaxID=6832 RepID=A0A553NFW9_TIGCA|nr:hypothetical protein TCAL_10250 [Tigriopus californicus]
MLIDWNELIRQFEACILRASPPNRAVGGAAEEGGEEAEVSPEAVTALNHKLIEVHSRLKALDDDCSIDTSTHSPAQGSAGATSLAPNLLQPHVMAELVGHCRTILSTPGRGPTHTLAAQLLAEVGRTAGGRGLCLKDQVTSALEGVLAEVIESQEPRVETVVQICRILGNLCYNCSEGRNQIIDSQCLQHIHTIASNRERIKSGDVGQRFPVILPGFLLNFCNESPSSVKRTGEVGFVDVIVENILTTKTNDAVFNASLNFFVVVAEDDRGQEFLRKSSNFANALNHVLIHTTSPEVTETALELVRSIAENPDLSLELAKSPLCSTLVKHIAGKWQTPEFHDHRTDACDLLVLILGHDANWLLTEDVQLMVAGCLCIGNFACNEEHCTQLMNNHTSQILVDLLRSHLNPNADLKLQHAILGAIRNLAVTAKARSCLLEQGLLDPCQQLMGRLSLMNAQPVVFKLLGTIRLVIDGSSEAAKQIGRSGPSIGKLVEWGNSDTQGVKSETARLLASLVKNSASSEVMIVIVDCGGLPHITTMITSSHVRMLNEGLVALTHLAAALNPDTVHAQLHTDLIVNGIKNILNHDSHPIEVKQNALTLTLTLLKARPQVFVAMLKEMELETILIDRQEQLRDMEQFQELNRILQGQAS